MFPGSRQYQVAYFDTAAGLGMFQHFMTNVLQVPIEKVSGIRKASNILTSRYLTPSPLVNSGALSMVVPGLHLQGLKFLTFGTINSFAVLFIFNLVRVKFNDRTSRHVY
jgi:hypothetical protein